jgi:hypothetical protein
MCVFVDENPVLGMFMSFINGVGVEDQLWNTPSLPSNEHRGIFPRDRATGIRS